MIKSSRWIVRHRIGKFLSSKHGLNGETIIWTDSIDEAFSTLQTDAGVRRLRDALDILGIPLSDVVLQAAIYSSPPTLPAQWKLWKLSPVHLSVS